MSNISKLTDEELEKLLNGESVDVVSSNDVGEFAKEFNIQAGSQSVSEKALYLTYQNWSTSKVNSSVFSQGMRALFEAKDGFIFIDVSKSLSRMIDYFDEKEIPYIPKLSKLVHTFLESHEIDSGTTPVEASIVYEEYKQWTLNRNQFPMGMDKFLKHVKQYLGTIEILADKRIVFNLNKDVISGKSKKEDQ